MSKKHKRRVSTKTSGETAPKAIAANPTSGKESRFSQGTEFNPDYGYVISDLKRIGILAVSFIAILVAVSFFIN